MLSSIRLSYPPLIRWIGPKERADFHASCWIFAVWGAVCSFESRSIQSRSSRAHGVDKLDLQTVDHQSFWVAFIFTACPPILVRFEGAWGAWCERQRKEGERAPGTMGGAIRRAGRAMTLRTIRDDTSPFGPSRLNRSVGAVAHHQL